MVIFSLTFAECAPEVVFFTRSSAVTACAIPDFCPPPLVAPVESAFCPPSLLSDADEPSGPQAASASSEPVATAAAATLLNLKPCMVLPPSARRRPYPRHTLEDAV